MSSWWMGCVQVVGKERERDGVTPSCWEGSSLEQGALVSQSETLHLQPALPDIRGWFGHWEWWGRRLGSWSP